jgi:alcohol dehydrogenase
MFLDEMAYYFKLMAKNALLDVCSGGNPRPVILEETVEIFEAAF